MRQIEIWKMIVINLIQNKFKVLLTSLGIVIGTITIILVIAIGRGGEKEIADQFTNMSAETVYINVQYSPNMDAKSVEKMTPEILEFMLEENPYLRDIYLRMITYQDVKVSGKRNNTILLGVTEGYLEISNFQIAEGEDFSVEDYESGNKNVVIGQSIAEKFFKSPEDAVGKYMQIKGGQYKVIGILKKESEGLQGVNPDDTVFIPYETLEQDKLVEDISIPQAVGRVHDTKEIPKAMSRMKSSLEYKMEDSSMYIIEDAGSRIDAAMQSATTMKMILISVAAIVFVVGGIGIMNVLFVSVKERTKEIGILKAIGTSKKDILLLFLLESVGIGCFGGIVGAILSCLILPLMKYTQIPVVSSIDGIMIAFLFAVITSGIFGFYPASKAASLKPIDALNME